MPTLSGPDRTCAEVTIVGAGAAGMAAALFLSARRPSTSIVLLDGAVRLGAKILISGGGRCNLTNRDVDADDFNGSRRPQIGAVLKALPVAKALAFFGDLGIATHEEERGRLFPDGNRAADVVSALADAMRRRGVEVTTRIRVTRAERASGGFRVYADTESPVVEARALLLATGGRSLPRSGSDGSGYSIARAMGHSIVPPVPALVPLELDGDFHRPLSGVSVEVALTLDADDLPSARSRGAMLFTHHGVSGPAVLDISRHWTRATAEGRAPHLTVSFAPGERFESIEAALLAVAADRPRLQIQSWLADRLPFSVARALLSAAGVEAATTLAHLSRDHRRGLVRLLVEYPLPVRRARGWDHAEATAGGVPLDETRTQTLESRLVPGLFFAGEILDVDGRLGGFNFQWAWASALVAADGIARWLDAAEPLGGTTGR